MADFSMTLRLEDALAENLRTLSKLTGASLSALAREAVREYVTAQLEEELFHAHSLASLKTYHENGLHVTLEELTPWLEGKEKELPQCHP